MIILGDDDERIPSDGEIYSRYGNNDLKKLVEDSLKDMFKTEDEFDGF